MLERRGEHNNICNVGMEGFVQRVNGLLPYLQTSKGKRSLASAMKENLNASVTIALVSVSLSIALGFALYMHLHT